MIDLIGSAFDLLILASDRGDSADALFLVRFFIVNKVPLLVSHISFDPYHSSSSAYIILEAVHRVEMRLGLAAELSASVPQAPAKTADHEVVRDFVQACLLHGLITSDQTHQIIGKEKGFMVPQRALETKQEALDLLHRKAEAADQIVAAGMTAMDGNAVSKAEAVAQVCLPIVRHQLAHSTQILHERCLARDTMGLKALCWSLATKPHALDALAISGDLTEVPKDLSGLLDGWQCDSDHSRSQLHHAVSDITDIRSRGRLCRVRSLPPAPPIHCSPLFALRK